MGPALHDIWDLENITLYDICVNKKTLLMRIPPLTWTWTLETLWSYINNLMCNREILYHLPLDGIFSLHLHEHYLLRSKSRFHKVPERKPWLQGKVRLPHNLT